MARLCKTCGKNRAALRSSGEVRCPNRVEMTICCLCCPYGGELLTFYPDRTPYCWKLHDYGYVFQDD
jgi:hypothetical protein